MASGTHGPNKNHSIGPRYRGVPATAPGRNPRGGGKPPSNRWQRYLFAFLCFILFLSVAFRSFLSDSEISRRVRAIVESQRDHYNVQFQAASLRFSDGPIPQLAIQLDQVSLSMAQVCMAAGSAATSTSTSTEAPTATSAPTLASTAEDQTPAVKMARLRVPFRFWRLLQGHLEAGEIEADDVVIDLDRLKDPCAAGTKPDVKSHPVVTAQESEPEDGVDAASHDVSHATATAPSKTSKQHWWSDAQLASLRAILRGVHFRRVDLRFETRHGSGKQVRLEEFLLALSESAAPDRVHVTSYLRIPAELTYGELLPPFSIEADANSSSANVKIKADLSEGSLESLAELHPNPGGKLWIEAKASVSDLPLSTTMPLFTKSGIVGRSLKPKFLWLNCGVSIKGEFQGLFETQPLSFEHCAIEGNGARISLGSAVREPDGRWAPFDVEVQQLDLKRVFETFGAQGPEGVASDYGRMTGQFKFESPRKIQFDGELEGAAVHFSNRNLRAIQTISRMKVAAELHGKEMRAKIQSVELLNGHFEGRLELVGDSEFRKARVNLLVEELTLDPTVQRLLVNGDLSAAKGKGEAQIRDGRLAAVEGDWFMNSLDGRDFRLRMVRLQTKYDGDVVNLQLKAPLLLLNQEGDFFASLKGIFFGHRFREPWVEIRDVTMHAALSGNREVQWDHASGSMEDGQIAVATSGRVTEDQHFDGLLSLDFPSAKKLKWSLGGELQKPVLKEESRSLEELHKKGPVGDEVLGIKPGH